MRTVTFSDAEIVKLLNEKFVCAWVNKAPEKKFADGLYGKDQRRWLVSNGGGVSNVTSVFAAADGTVIHAMPGMLDAGFFRFHLDIALKIHARMYAKGVAADQRAKIYAEAHVEMEKESEYRPLLRKVHKTLGSRLLNVGEFPVDFFDALEPKVTVMG